MKNKARLQPLKGAFKIYLVVAVCLITGISLSFSDSYANALAKKKEAAVKRYEPTVGDVVTCLPIFGPNDCITYVANWETSIEYQRTQWWNNKTCTVAFVNTGDCYATVKYPYGSGYVYTAWPKDLLLKN